MSIEKMVLDNSPFLIFLLKVGKNFELYFEYFNQTAMRETGFTKDIIGKRIQDVYEKKKANYMYHQCHEAIFQAKHIVFQDSYINPSDITIYTETKLTPIYDRDTKQCTHILAVVKDVTEERLIRLENKKANERLIEREQHFRIIAEHAHDLITLLDNNEQIMYISPSHKRILGFSQQELIGKHYLQTVYPEDRRLVEEKIKLAIRSNSSFKIQFQKMHKTKKWIFVEVSGTPVYDEQRQFVHMVLVTRDITKQKEYESKLEYLAHHDTLTGLPNRYHFNEALKKAITQYEKQKEGLAILMVDIDNFKDINDQLGHDVGDMVIEQFGKRLAGCLWGDDLGARLGGDEFAIILSGISKQNDAVNIAKRIHQEITSKPFSVEEQEIPVTISIGIALVSADKINELALMKIADMALYEAKNSGKNGMRIKTA